MNPTDSIDRLWLHKWIPAWTLKVMWELVQSFGLSELVQSFG
jgi:hypothetical protein